MLEISAADAAGTGQPPPPPNPRYPPHAGPGRACPPAAVARVEGATRLHFNLPSGRAPRSRSRRSRHRVAAITLLPGLMRWLPQRFLCQRHLPNGKTQKPHPSDARPRPQAPRNAVIISTDRLVATIRIVSSILPTPPNEYPELRQERAPASNDQCCICPSRDTGSVAETPFDRTATHPGTCSFQATPVDSFCADVPERTQDLLLVLTIAERSNNRTNAALVDVFAATLLRSRNTRIKHSCGISPLTLRRLATSLFRASERRRTTRGAQRSHRERATRPASSERRTSRRQSALHPEHQSRGRRSTRTSPGLLRIIIESA